MTFIKKKGEGHEHKFDTELRATVALRKIVQEDGKHVPDVMTAKDTLKQRKCSCGAVETYDLVRTLA